MYNHTEGYGAWEEWSDLWHADNKSARMETAQTKCPEIKEITCFKTDQEDERYLA